MIAATCQPGELTATPLLQVELQARNTNGPPMQRESTQDAQLQAIGHFEIQRTLELGRSIGGHSDNLLHVIFSENQEAR
jgi:hypothetical protein